MSTNFELRDLDEVVVFPAQDELWPQVELDEVIFVDGPWGCCAGCLVSEAFGCERCRGWGPL